MKLLTSTLLLSFFWFGLGSPREPLKVKFENSASYRWLNKKVLESRKLDDMENLSGWEAFTIGNDEIVDARVVAKVKERSNVAALSLDTQTIHSGRRSLLMRTPVKLEGPGPSNGRGWGRSGVKRHFDGEDWTHFNRLSLWIYADLPGFYTSALDFKIYNDGVKKLPALFGQEGETSIVLRNHEWNHIVWEIGNVERDKIKDFEISYGLSGNAPGEVDSIRFYFDCLDLERVEPDKIEGWDVWPGRISYSHAGYQAGAEKSAVANGLDASTFQLIDQQTGEVVLSRPIQNTTTHLGTFQVMDFSEVRKEGTYVLEAGGVSTHPFPIGPDVWDASIWKALNFFYAERCGTEIPGIHGICHRDWTCVHNDRRIAINGGWHDAGDLTQGLGNTGEIVYGLFSLAEQLQTRDEKPELVDRLIEEGRWGLDWILKTSFGDGFRDVGSISSRRTNDIIGDFDDVTATARNSPQDNFVAAAAEAIAARVLKSSDPRLAAHSLQMARSDYKFAVEGMKTVRTSSAKQLWTGTFDSDNIAFEVSAEGILAAVNLWKITGDRQYEDQAAQWSQVILQSQQRQRTDWEFPLTGFFYTGPQKDRLLHFVHRGRQQAHILALTELCQAFPDHSDWMKWYSSVALYDEYVKSVSTYTAPYNVLPASVYNDSEYLKVPESRRESFRKQVLNGIPLGKGNYLRLFPVWMDYRGHFGTILPEAQALAGAAHLRGDLAAAKLAEHQLEWVIGRNPFSQSAMWGEGYDFTPLYTPSSGDMVGALPVGIQTKEENDAPYWPVQATWTYKEIWVHPVARWIWLMRDLRGPALIEGQAAATVVFKELTTGQEVMAEPDGTTQHFRILLPEGKYTVQTRDKTGAIASDPGIQDQTFLPGGTYHLDLRPGKSVSFEISTLGTGKGNRDLLIRVNASGLGTHHFSIRTDNLRVAGASQLPVPTKDITLQHDKPGIIEWRATITSPDTPWFIVVIPDDDLSQRKEKSGAIWQRPN